MTGSAPEAGEPTGESIPKIGLEILVLWLVVNLIIRGVRVVWEATGFELILVAAPILFLYAPVLMCRLRGVDSWSYPLAIPPLRDGRFWLRTLGLFGVVVLATTAPFILGYHAWHLYVLGSVAPTVELPVAFPSNLLLLMGYHLFFVAIPEEIFYRGYLQTRIDEAFSPRMKLLGATVGPGLILATILFAFGHSIVVFRPWHVAIIFPGLLFAWMRARTGEVMAGAFFHAWCNVMVTTLDVMYGLQEP
ncbi:MAG: CPBP family intramembrane metalloprotease [Deltaproteobacteria bacterium]|nr:MAG: CPBP family intramembrane metalloprotease [Deltaproteobacteria bacterium]